MRKHLLFALLPVLLMPMLAMAQDTDTPTPTVTPTWSPTATYTSTPTWSPTWTGTSTVTPTSTPTRTKTPSPVPSPWGSTGQDSYVGWNRNGTNPRQLLPDYMDPVPMAKRVILYDGSGSPVPTVGPAPTAYPQPTAIFTPAWTKLDQAVSGAVTVVSATNGQQVRVHAVDLECAGATTLWWTDTAGATIVGPQAWVANEGKIVGPYLEPFFWFASPVSTGLVLNSNSTNQCGGLLNYNKY